MSKGFKQIIIAAAIIGVFTLGILILSIFVPKEQSTVLPSESLSPSESTESVVHYVIKEDGNSIRKIENFYSDGTSLAVSFTPDDDGRFSYDVEPPSQYFAYNTSKFRSMMFTLSSLTAIALIEENPSDIAKYGLDNPQFSMKITFEDKTITLKIGNPTPVDFNFYCMTDDSSTVYTLGNYIGKLVMRSELEYRDIPTFPQYTEEEIYTNINHVTLTQKNGTVIDIVLDSELSMEGNAASSAYMLLSPVLSSGNDENIQTNIMDVVSAITYGGIVSDIPASDIALYGFDNPARLQLYDISGNYFDIVIGSPTGVNNTYYYAAISDQYFEALESGIDLSLLLYSAEAFTWLDLNYATLINRAAWLQDIHTIESINYMLDGKDYHLELFEYDDVTNSGVDVVRTEGIFDGKNLNEDDTKRLFARTLNLRQIASIPPGSDLSNPQYTVTLNLRDGGKRTMELVRLNDRQYACIVDGVADFYVYYSNIRNLLLAIERIQDNREVPLIYYT